MEPRMDQPIAVRLSASHRKALEGLARREAEGISATVRLLIRRSAQDAGCWPEESDNAEAEAE